MIQITVQTAQGFLSFNPPTGDGQACVVEYRPTQGGWETLALPGLEEAIRAIVQEELAKYDEGGAGPTPPPADTTIPATESADYVAQVKAALEAQGVSLSGPDGAFQITSNVAYGLRHVGYGLLEKTSGNMSQGYATDVIVCPNRIDLVDILGDSGGQNTPSWHVKPNEVTSDRWRPPVTPAHPV